MRITVRLRILLPLLLCLSWLPPIEAQTASLVRDLQPESDFNPGNANPSQLLAARGKVFFEAQEPTTGAEVWVSDGTAAGTELLADSCSNDCSGEPAILGSGGNFVFWVAGTQLWRSDGTRAGTQPLLPGALRVASPEHGGSFAFLDGVLFFEGCTVGDGALCALWRSDGTAAGTRIVKQITAETNYRSIGFLGTAARRLFLLSGDRTGFFVWTSDGTEAGTAVVRQLPFFPRGTVAAGNRIFMIMPAPGEKEELWASDGTAVGTLALASFRAVDFFRGISWLKPIGDRVYFPGDDVALGQEIWRSDGTPQGTQRMTSFGFHEPFRGGLNPDQLEEVGNLVVFFATDGLSNVKLWSSAGAQTPAAPLAEACLDCAHIDFQWKLARLDGRVLFQGFDSAHGHELWATDGTASGTVRLTDVCAGPCDSVELQPTASAGAIYTGLSDQRGRHSLWRSDGQGIRRIAEPEEGASQEIVTAGGKIFFAARDRRHGVELWVSDGTPAGSGPVTDIAHGDEGSHPSALTPLFNGIAFLAGSPEGRVWISGGTAGTTTAVTSNVNHGSAYNLIVAGGRIFFYGDDSYPPQVWTPDGTPGGLLQLTSFDDDLDFTPAGSLIEHQGRLLFAVANRDILEMWTSDGTLPGTGRAFTLPSTMRSMEKYKSLGGQLFLMARDNQGCHPWLSDGTTPGTRRLSELDFNCFSSRELEVARVGSRILFTADRLWTTDGTAAGTSPLHPSDFFEDGAKSLTAFQNALYYLALAPRDDRPRRPWALWRSDGTEAGSTVVREFEGASLLMAAGGRLFLAADDGVHGTELWTSDGTAAGTVLVQDILPGLNGSNLSAFATASGRLYFAANDGVHGTELWVSDGAAAGTRLVQDLAPGALSSRPELLTLAVDRLFFTADDGLTGREPWVLPLDTAPGTCTPSETSLCLGGGRFRVEALWRDAEGRFQPGRAVGLTPDTGYFWFFSPTNVEAVLKVLDGRGSNGHFWVFYGALSNVEYALTVTDTQTGLTRRYFNLQGRFASVGDNHAFGPLGAFKRREPASPEAAPLLVHEGFEPATGTCVPAPRRLCLTGGRFAVEAKWQLPDRNGAGIAGGITSDTGYFWFFNAANIEAVVKVLDATAANGHFWVFYGGLSNVEYELTVTDTMTGRTKTYKNPRGRFASAGDTTAF